MESSGVAKPFDGVPAHVECAVRRNDDHEFVFLLNHDAEATTTVPLGAGGTDLLSGRTVSGEMNSARSTPWSSNGRRAEALKVPSVRGS